MLIPIIQVKGVILLSTPDLNDCVQIRIIKAVQKKRNCCLTVAILISLQFYFWKHNLTCNCCYLRNDGKNQLQFVNHFSGRLLYSAL